MFDLRSYSYDEMCKAFKTDRNDCIKKKLTTLGYTFTTSGRGKKIQFDITAYNKPELYDFKQFCIEELGYDVRTDFKKLYLFYSKFFFDEEYRKLPYVVITRKLESEMEISRQTISKHINRLVNLNVLGLGEFFYYAHGYDKDGNKQAVSISEKLYKDGWTEYWTGKETDYSTAMRALLAYVHGIPQKVPEKIFNAFEWDKIQRLMDIIKKEKKENGENI